MSPYSQNRKMTTAEKVERKKSLERNLILIKEFVNKRRRDGVDAFELLRYTTALYDSTVLEDILKKDRVLLTFVPTDAYEKTWFVVNAGVAKAKWHIDVHVEPFAVRPKDVDSFVSFYEHLLVSILIKLWIAKGDLPRNTDDEKIKRCLLATFFFHTPLSEEKAGCYVWHQNSCYLDSLLAVILDCDSDFWRRTIFTHNPTTREGKKFRTALFDDYREMESGETLECGKVRSTLLPLLPDMKCGRRWVFYNVGEVYDAIADLFPELKMTIPEKIRRGKKRVFVKEHLATIAFPDFLGHDESDPKEILFDDLTSEALVFLNGGVPRIRVFDRTGVEKGWTHYGNTKHHFAFDKTRAFGETILDGRYRLVGIVTLLGVGEIGEGSHYIAYVLKGGEWYLYDGAGDQPYTRLTKLPRAGVWEDRHGRFPAMYFYAKTE